MRKLSLLCFSLLFATQVFSQTGSFNIKNLEKEIQQVIRQTYNSAVYITPYDSIAKKAVGGLFSGVVIDTAGYILSAAHAVRANNLYEITFPDGKKYKAIGLGRIPSVDAAMLKITEKGNWSYAPMGWSSSLKKDMPCISIAYPGTVGAKKPTVRLGYIAEPINAEGFIRSTCLMEPGDSGGPLFDMKGRVIGLHSKIDLSPDANFEVPVDLYRKYWNSLIKPLTYLKDQLPPTVALSNDSLAGALKPVAEMTRLNTMVKEINDELSKNSVLIKSIISKGTETSILGTLVKLDGFIPDRNLKNRSFLLSKSSMVGSQAIAELATKKIALKVLSRDDKNDLVLLQMDHKTKYGIELATIPTAQLSHDDLGKLLISVQPEPEGIVSVLGNTSISITRGPTPAVIGISPGLKEGKVVINNIQRGGPASTAALEIGDELLSFNGNPILSIEDLGKQMVNCKPNDTVTLQLSRAGVPFSKKVALQARRIAENHIAYQFTDGRSERRTDFDNILIHDGKLKPAACGGPLYDINGQFYGINIARFSRTSSLAIPAATVSKFVKDNISLL